MVRQFVKHGGTLLVLADHTMDPIGPDYQRDMVGIGDGPPPSASRTTTSTS